MTPEINAAAIAELLKQTHALRTSSRLIAANIAALAERVDDLSAKVADVQALDAGPNAKRLAALLVKSERAGWLSATDAAEVRDAHKPQPAPPPAGPAPTPAPTP